jgi:hypothetical protein
VTRQGYEAAPVAIYSQLWRDSLQKATRSWALTLAIESQKLRSL